MFIEPMLLQTADKPFDDEYSIYVIGIKLLGQNYIVPVLDGLFYISFVHSGQNN